MNFALYDRAKAADDAYQAALVAEYGPSCAQDARYRFHHSSPAVESAMEAKLAADIAWRAEMLRARIAV